MFSGEVSHGQVFEREFGDGLLFRLAGSGDTDFPGWTIEIRSKGSPGFELSSVVTPPHRFWNPRYLNASYGLSASESVAIDVRSFSFLRNPADFPKADEALAKALWPNGISQEEVDKAIAALDAIPTCSGTLKILDHRLAKDSRTGIERIDWLRFDVELCPGRGQASLQELPPKSRVYESTHGKTLNDVWAPYVEAYAGDYGVVLNNVLVRLLPQSVQKAAAVWFVSSHRRVDGNFTYFVSNSVVLFDLLKVRCGQGDEALVALYNVAAGEKDGWRLAVLRNDYSVAKTHDLPMKPSSKEDDLYGDMIYADLSVAENALSARVTYVVTGTGGYPEQGFEYQLRQEGDSCTNLQLRGIRFVTGQPGKR
jgi:hypothetical protein